MNSRYLLIKVSSKLAAKIYSGETDIIPCRQIPDPGTLAPERLVFLCENSLVTGYCRFVEGKASHEPICPDEVKDLYGLHVGWVVKNPVRYDEPRNLREFKLKKEPDEWKYVKV